MVAIGTISKNRDQLFSTVIAITARSNLAIFELYMLQNIQYPKIINCSAWSKPKLNTKIGLHTTTHPPQTFWPFPDKRPGFKKVTTSYKIINCHSPNSTLTWVGSDLIIGRTTHHIAVVYCTCTIVYPDKLCTITFLTTIVCSKDRWWIWLCAICLIL